jgi:predicted dehydrogenase
MSAKMQMNRREFLAQSAAVGAAALAGRSAGAQETRPSDAQPPRKGPNEEIRVACVGLGGMGRHHIRIHASAPNVRVVTLCDIDENLLPERVEYAQQTAGSTPKTEYDIRRVLDDKDVDCISAATPNHWHALVTVWACQAGKDVYVQKPASHNVFEGRRMVDAARKYGRVVQVGLQNRSSPGVREAMRMLREGVIGDVYMARALCYNQRESIGVKPDAPAAPAGVHYDLWLGPAPVRPFNPNRFHYNWHWHWDYGNGDIGNQGVHQMDIARWGLNKKLPVRVHSMGGRYAYHDQGETPNTQVSTFQYPDGTLLVFEVRNLDTHKEWEVDVGNLFYGSKGYMAIRGDTYEVVLNDKPGPKGGRGDADHFQNFHDVVRSRRLSDLNCDVEEGHYSAALCHLANISYRLGRSLDFDPEKEEFPSDQEANTLLTRAYRKPFVVPERV